MSCNPWPNVQYTPVYSYQPGTTSCLQYTPPYLPIGPTGPSGPKTFVIDHPLDTTKYLVHACLEGPEAGVYYRGTTQVLDTFVEVLLPSYISALAHNFTVNVTHVYNEGSDTEVKTYAATPVKNNSFRIYGPEGTVSWVVYGSRTTIEVEPLKASVDVKGSGPYKWI
jgi:hypothetical protein